MKPEQPFTKEEREKILQGYANAMRAYNKHMDDGDFDQADEAYEKAAAFEKEYESRLPRITMCCCPYCAKPLVRTFDPFGFDGLWWEQAAAPREMPTCTHFCVLLGAVNYNGLPPKAGGFEANPGPEVPYVVPDLLNHPDMIAVISKVDMENGYTAFPIAYFAKKRPPDEKLTAGWARKMHVYKTQMGEDGWRYPYYKWDFDLTPWIMKGNVLWCAPDSDNRTLITDAAARYPYLNMSGLQKNIFIEKDVVTPMNPPDGTPIGPYDWD